MVMGAGGAGSPAVFAEPPVGAGATPAVLPGRPADAEERVSSFRVTVSPGAYQLAVRLSAVLHGRWQAGLARALQRAVLPGSGQVELAEVLLGGLVRQAERRDGQAEPEFEFLDGVGAVLQRTLTGTEALGVLQAVAGYLERETGASPGIAARLLGEAPPPATEPGELAGVREAAANLIDTMGLARPQPSPSPPPSEAAEEAVAVEGAAEVAAEAPVAPAATSGVLPPSDAPSASQLTQVLYLNVSAPERIPLGGRASVIIRVSEGQADAQAAVSVPFRKLALSAADMVMSMSLHLSGLDLVGEESASIMVLATGPSEPKRFEVRATGTGAARVRVTARVGGTLIADAHLDITVEPRVRRRAEDQPAELGDRMPAPELPPGPRHALIVATGLYRDAVLAQLRSVVDGAEGLAAVLGDPGIGGFTVRQLTNPTLGELWRALFDFLEERSGDDTILVYLSGHGLVDRAGRLYLAATDTVPERLESTALPAAYLTAELDRCRARQVVILDCAFSGAFGRGEREATVVQSLAEEEAPSPGGRPDGPDPSSQLAGTSRSREVIAASSAFEAAFERGSSAGPSTGSVFTSGLLEGLQTGAADANDDGYVTVDDVYRYAYQYVRESGAAQTPQRFSDVEGPSVVLARNPRGRAVVPAAPPDDGQNAQATSTPASGPPASPAWDHVAGLSGHLDSVSTLAFSPDGRLLATGGADGAVRVWDPSLAIPLHTLTATRNPVNALAFSPDGRLLATGGADGAVWIWDPATGSLLQTLAPPDGDVFALAFRPDGLLAGSVGDNVVVIWDLADVARARGLDAGPGPVRTLAFSRDGLLATGGGSQPVRIWDVEKNLRWELPSPQYAVNALAFSPDGRLLATGGEQGVAIWDPFTRGLLRGLPIQRTVEALAFSPDSRLLAIGTEGLTDISNVAEERLPEALLRVSGVVRALAFSPDGRLLAIGSSTGGVELWRTGPTGDQRAAQGTQ
jgi:WD40 repeat protein